MMNNYIKILSILLLSLISEISFAENMGQKKFEGMVDYVNCTLTRNYISLLLSDSDKANYKKIANELLKNNLEKPVDYATLSKLLRTNHFKGTDSTLTSMINKTKSQFNNSTTNKDLIAIVLNLSTYSDKYNKALAENVISLKNELIQKFPTEMESAKIVDDNGPQNFGEKINRNTEPEREMRKTENLARKSSSFDLLTLIISIIISLSFSLLVLFYIKDQFEHFSRKQSSKNEVSKLVAQIEEYKFLIKSLEKTISKLTNQIEDINIKALPGILEDIKKLEFAIQTKPNLEFKGLSPNVDNQVELMPKEFFMSTPNEDGSFYVSQKADSHVLSVTLYKFIYENKELNRAKFSIDGDEMAILDALNSTYKYLEPVCKIENSEYKNATRIETILPGIAKLQGDKWIVSPDHKAKIKLI